MRRWELLLFDYFIYNKAIGREVTVNDLGVILIVNNIFFHRYVV